MDFAERLGRPLRVVDLDAPEPSAEVRSWIAAAGIRVLNIAGPRESTCPGIAATAAAYLAAMLDYVPVGDEPL